MRRLGPLALAALCAACGGGEADGRQDLVPVPGREGVEKSAAAVRAGRRAFDGAPPVVPHQDFGVTCLECHGATRVEVPDLGFSPPMPHGATEGLSAISRCTQCHLFRDTDELFRESTFAGAPQALQLGPRAHDFAPPRIPHPRFLRENCLACHDGPAAREDIRCTHAERAACTQCHLEVRAADAFARR